VSFLIAYYTAVNKTTQQKHPWRRLRSRFISSTDPLTLSCVKLWRALASFGRSIISEWEGEAWLHFNNFLSARRSNANTQSPLSEIHSVRWSRHQFPSAPFAAHFPPHEFLWDRETRAAPYRMQSQRHSARRAMQCTRSLDRVPVYSGKNEPPESDKMLPRPSFQMGLRILIAWIFLI
jgi:hypothetical protein